MACVGVGDSVWLVGWRLCVGRWVTCVFRLVCVS